MGEILDTVSFLKTVACAISLVWVCPRVPRFIKGFGRAKYMCFCPQIEPVEVASVLEKPFRSFHDKHGIGEVELKWSSRVGKPQLERTASGALPSFWEVWPPWGEAALGGALQKFVQQHDCHLEDRLTGEKMEVVFQDVSLTEVATKAGPCLTTTTSHLLTFAQQFFWI